MSSLLRSDKSQLLPEMISVVRSVLPVGMCLLAVTTAEWAQQQSTQPTRPIHMVRRMVDPNPLKPPGSTLPPSPGPLGYYGGPVISNLQVVVVFWGPDVYPPVTAGIAAFFQNITNSAYFDLLSEYDTNVTPLGGGTGTNQSIGRGTYGGSFTIAPSVCNVSPCVLTDDQVQTEFLSQLNAGQLPTPELDSNGNVNTLYMIYFPPGVTIKLEKYDSCNQFCAYHSTTINTFNSKNLAYGVMPDFSPPDGCRQGCGSGTDFENITAVSSHEMAEAITDVDVGIAPLNAPPMAWYDPAFGTGEIGDICDHEDSEVSTPGGPFLVQLLWSNQLSACVTIGAHPSFQVTAPITAMPETSFNFTVTVENPGGSSTDTSFAGTVHFTSSDPGAVLPADFTFTPNDQGTQIFAATLKRAGPEPVTATDTVNGAIIGTATLTVGGTILTVAPTSLAYNSQPIGTTSFAGNVTLTNETGGTISIASITITGANASDFAQMATTCGSTLGVTTSCTVSVTFTPGGLGARSATLAIMDGAGNSPQQVALSGTGIVQVSVTPVAIKFPATKVGKTSAVSIVGVKNNLKTPLRFSGSPFTFTGTNPGDFAQSATTCRSILAANARCTVSIKFTPTAKGIRTAVLNVVDSASPSPQTANLSGSGK